MTFSIEINSPRWRNHLSNVLAEFSNAGSAVVPVIKSNGYGLGQDFLASVASDLQSAVVAVGTIFEAESLLRSTKADVLVLQPFDPRDEIACDVWKSLEESNEGRRIIRVISSEESFQAVLDIPATPRVIFECATDLNRFGFKPSEIVKSWPAIVAAHETAQITIEGITFHFPLTAQNSDTALIVRTVKQLQEVNAHFVNAVWVSHLGAKLLQELQAKLSNITVHSRVGSKLWLGDRDALKTYATVLAVTEVNRGDVAGYRRKKVPGKGWIITVAGGTAHGVALSAPSSVANSRQRAVAFASGILESIGAVRSPFSYNGLRLMFLETPHQHVSQLFLPAVNTPPRVGDQLEVTVRFTTTHADVVKEIS